MAYVEPKGNRNPLVKPFPKPIVTESETKVTVKTLFDLYKIHSPSFREEDLSEYVELWLKKIGITDYNVDGTGMIWRIKEGQPLLSSHLDQVGTDPVTELVVVDTYKVMGDKNIGADDKNGVWLTLKCLEKYPDLSFIFSTGEECGSWDLNRAIGLKEIQLNMTPYALVLDRRGSSDIIGDANFYCCKDLMRELERVGSEFKYVSEQGLWSDADILSG